MNEERDAGRLSIMSFNRLSAARKVGSIFLLASLEIAPSAAQQLDASSVIRHIDAAVESRVESVVSFTVNEHYAVYRSNNEIHPAAEMTVKTTYDQGAGKSYTIISQSGSVIIRKFGLLPLLENEKSINQPGNVERSWFTSANYDMKLKSGGIQRQDGRDCIALSIKPQRKATNLIDGTLWVDAKDYQIARIEGVASKNPSILAGTTQMMRQYQNVDGFAMATHARAESNSFLFGRIVVVIDYSDYQIRLHPKN